MNTTIQYMEADHVFSDFHSLNQNEIQKQNLLLLLVK